MNRYSLELAYFHIKKERILFLISLLVIYLLGLPMCINTLNSVSLERNSSIILCFNTMQKVVLPMVLIIQSILFRSYVDTQYREVVFTLDRRKKWEYIYLYISYVQVGLLPFYLILYYCFRDIGIYLLVFSFQIFILTVFYYMIAMLTKSTLISVGFMIAYLFFCSFMYVEQGFGNFLLINASAVMIPIPYYTNAIIAALLMMGVGSYFENKF